VSVVALVGAQWGDEGKGKITDFLAREADCVVRYQGGSNAGHTVVDGGRKYMLHLMPSGILYPDKLCVIGNGVALDLAILVEELKTLESQGIDTSNLRISNRAHILMPYHKKFDELQEHGGRQLGTTRRGIGPAYADKMERVGFRLADVMDTDFPARFAVLVREKNRILQRLYDHAGYDHEAMLDKLLGYVEYIQDYIADTSLLVNQVIDKGRKVLLEGAQGTLLDIDHGTYPYVTSSYPTAGGACIGAGVGPTRISRVVGVAKAYSTRVGEGPFPTELDDEAGSHIRERGAEFGTTTGRPRRCGWLDAVVLRYAARVNGLTDLAITKIDVLDEMDTVKICVGYRWRGKIIQEFPDSLRILQDCEPVYIEMEGWKTSLSGCRTYEELPTAARRYIDQITELTGVRHCLIATGPERNQTIVTNEVFARK
jgi:adenylosuccinate synthase